MHAWYIHLQTLEATKRFSLADWQKKFVIEFAGEEGTAAIAVPNKRLNACTTVVACMAHSAHECSAFPFISGLDYGGLSREFVELLCQKLFNEGSGCFIRLEEDNQQAPVSRELYCDSSNDAPLFSLQVHPNAAYTCYQHYDLAGKLVGKCLMECALENTLLLNVNFTRSLLAQLIGLKVNYSVSRGRFMHTRTITHLPHVVL